MNIIFKRFEGEENWPHLIETPKETGVYEFDISPENKKNLENRILSAKAMRLPFRKEDRGEITNECWYSETKDLPNPHEDYWQPDPEKIYSIDRKCENEEMEFGHVDDFSKPHGFQKFAILLKEETVKEEFYKYGQLLGIKINDLQRLKILATQSVIKEAKKEESQDTLMNELMNAWRLGANIKGLQSKFHITRIK